MKKILLSILAAAVLTLSATAVSASTLSPALDIIAGENEMTVSGLTGEAVTFTGEQFALAAGADEYDSIRITSLPDQSKGTLYYNDGAVCAGQVIPYDKTDRLSFEPAEGVSEASFEFTFDGSYTMTCAIKLEASVNKAPTAGGTPEQYTFASTPCTGNMRAADPDGDSLTYEIVEYPQNGRLIFDKSSGDFTYTPSSYEGTDSFVYRAVDDMGAVSPKATVCVNIEKSPAAITFEDMSDSSYIAAAVTMADKGVMTYSEKDDKLYFEPAGEVSRLDFLVSAMNTFGAGKLPDVADSGFLDDADIPAEYKSYVYSAKKLGIVKGIETDGKCCFMPDKPITLAEASVIINNIIGYTAAESINCEDTVPVWAKEAVDAVYELGISDISAGKIGATEVMTREKAAQMLYRVSNLIYE